MAEIKAAEISAILKEQLAHFDANASLEEVGTVLQVGDGIARIFGLSNAQYGELVKFDNGTNRGFIFGSSRLLLSIATVIVMNLVPHLFLL